MQSLISFLFRKPGRAVEVMKDHHHPGVRVPGLVDSVAIQHVEGFRLVTPPEGYAGARMPAQFWGELIGVAVAQEDGGAASGIAGRSLGKVLVGHDNDPHLIRRATQFLGPGWSAWVLLVDPTRLAELARALRVPDGSFAWTTLASRQADQFRRILRDHQTDGLRDAGRRKLRDRGESHHRDAPSPDPEDTPREVH